jgi:stage II sporulation protein D
VNPRLAFEQSFPPGSTIKTFTALMALRAGLLDGETRTICPGTFKRDGFQITCSHPKSKAPFTLAQALAYSCNVFFAGLSERLSPASFRSTLAGYGFGERTGINAPEASGSLAMGDWHVRDGVGEGRALLATPLQMLAAYTALFNGGHLFRPRLAGADSFRPEERASMAVDDAHREILIRGCRGAVEYGTAAESDFESLPFYAFGKTGTAAASNEFRRHGWFVCMVADQPAQSRETPAADKLNLAVAVFLKRGHGWEAAAVARRLLETFARSNAASSQTRVTESSIANCSLSGAASQPGLIRVRVLRENRTIALPLEEYVLGVMAVEASIEDEIEALKAQAIISRTYAVKNLNRHGSQGYDLCSNTHCQQFRPTQHARIREALRVAVNETSGQVLKDEQGNLVDAYFHAACGGMTANIETLWGAPAPVYLKGVRDQYCAGGPHRNWTDRITAERLLHGLRKDPRSNVGRTLEDVAVSKRDATGRAERVVIEGERHRELRGWEFKVIVGRALGWNLIKSTRFEVRRVGTAFVFKGSGFGHGLGLCQEGAHVMAEQAVDFRRILSFYFPRTRIEPWQIGRADSSDARVAEPRLRVADWRSPVCRPVTEVASVPISYRPAVPVLDLPNPQSPGLSLSSEHFLVRYTPSLARNEVESVLRRLEGARASMLRRLRPAAVSFNEVRIEVVLHKSTQDFAAATGQPVFAAGATRGNRIQLQPLGVLKRRRILESTLSHEYAHAVINALGGERCSRWLVEGLAIRFAGEGPALLGSSRGQGPEARHDLDDRLAQPASSKEMRELYAEAYRRVAALIKREGEAAQWRKVSNCAGGRQAGGTV